MNRLLFSILSLSLLFFSCSQDDSNNVFTDNSTISALQISENAAMSISYDMTVSTFISPFNKEDKDEMTEAEKILSIPKPMGCRVVEVIKTNGKKDADIEMIQFDGLPTFPDNMIGNQKFPEKLLTKRIEVRDGISTHFNSSNEVIANSTQSEADELFLKELMTDIEEVVRISAEDMDLVIQAFKDEGFDLRTDSRFDNIEIMTVQNSDQTTTQLYLDKDLQVIRGRDNLDSNGELDSSSHFIYDDAGEMIGHWFATYYTSPFSNNPMVINKISKLENLSITINQ